MRSLSNFDQQGLYQVMPVRLRSKLDALGHLKTYGDGQHIQSRGDRTKGFSIIISGAVCFRKIDAGGTFITVAVFGAEQCYGEFTLFADLPRTHDGVAGGKPWCGIYRRQLFRN